MLEKKVMLDLQEKQALRVLPGRGVHVEKLERRETGVMLETKEDLENLEELERLV